MEKTNTTVKSASSTYDVTIVTSAEETCGKFSLLEVNIAHGGGNDMHFHTKFSEHFEILSGVLSVQVEKRIYRLGAGERYTVVPYIAHRFFNDSGAPTLFRCKITPARNFEKAILIGSGLAKDGLVNKNGLPKSFWHLMVLFELSESYMAGLPLWFQRSVFGTFARVARWMGVHKKLAKYYENESSVVRGVA